jgi:LPPG:FO 2-phospho-L-lactate transferase
VEVVPAPQVEAIVNTGDDVVLHGLHVSPDLDTVTYTLADAVPPERGWGLDGESWAVMDALERYGKVAPAGSGAAATWFRLGDRDLATHLYRTHRLAEGAPLSAVTAEVAAAWGVDVVLRPMTDDPVATVMVLPEGEIGFQDYFVRRRHSVAVTGVRFAGVDAARPGPGVIEALAAADVVLICPSNPIVSVGPILAVPGIRAAVAARREATVAVSPIVAGAALKGPADRLMAELGHEVSVAGVARLYAPLAATLVVDTADAALAPAVEAAGMRCVVAPAVMHGVPEAAALAEVALTAAQGARRR